MYQLVGDYLNVWLIFVFGHLDATTNFVFMINITSMKIFHWIYDFVLHPCHEIMDLNLFLKSIIIIFIVVSRYLGPPTSILILKCPNWLYLKNQPIYQLHSSNRNKNNFLRKCWQIWTCLNDLKDSNANYIHMLSLL